MVVLFLFNLVGLIIFFRWYRIEFMLGFYGWLFFRWMEMVLWDGYGFFFGLVMVLKGMGNGFLLLVFMGWFLCWFYIV